MTKKKSSVVIKQRLIDLRLGLKLKDVFWPFDTLSLADTLTKLGYANIQQSPDQRVIIADKKQTRFYLDQSKLAFGFHSDTIESLITAQKEFFATIQKDLRVNMSEHIKFYEIEHKVKKLSENNTYDLISNLYGGSTDINAISQIIGMPIKVNGINVIKQSGSPENNSWYQIEVLPLVTSVPNTFICRLLYRDPSQQVVYNTLRKSAKVFDDLISYLES